MKIIKVHKPFKSMIMPFKNETNHDSPETAILRAIEDYPSKDSFMIGTDVSSKLVIYNVLIGNKEGASIFWSQSPKEINIMIWGGIKGM